MGFESHLTELMSVCNGNINTFAQLNYVLKELKEGSSNNFCIINDCEDDIEYNHKEESDFDEKRNYHFLKEFLLSEMYYHEEDSEEDKTLKPILSFDIDPIIQLEENRVENNQQNGNNEVIGSTRFIDSPRLLGELNDRNRLNHTYNMTFGKNFNYPSSIEEVKQTRPALPVDCSFPELPLPQRTTSTRRSVSITNERSSNNIVFPPIRNPSQTQSLMTHHSINAQDSNLGLSRRGDNNEANI